MPSLKKYPPTEFPIHIDIQIAREWVMLHRFDKNGCVCGVCDGLAKVYRNTIKMYHSHFLFGLYEASKSSCSRVNWLLGRFPWIDVRRHPLTKPFSNGQHAWFGKHWKLIETQLNTDTRKKDSGLWRLRRRGVAFIEGRRRECSYVDLYKDTIVEWSEEEIYIQEVFGLFDYDELMQGLPDLRQKYLDKLNKRKKRRED